MDTITPVPDRPARRSRLKNAFLICAAGGAAFLAALLLGVGVPIVRECVRPITPPQCKDVPTGLLIRDQATAAETKLPAAPGPAAKTTPASVQAAVSSRTLQFKPFIPDAPNIPPKVRAVRNTLNADFDRMLAEIDAYEKAKAELTYEQARQRLDRIYKTKDEIWAKIIEINGDSFPSEGWTGEVFQRHQNYMQWKWAAEVEINDKGQKWNEAALSSVRLMNQKRIDWELRYWDTTPNQPIFRSDFFRQNGTQDWDRMIIYYRRTGGPDGYAHIVSAVLGRQKERFIDFLSRTGYRISSTIGRR